jgi:hypothetical protein
VAATALVVHARRCGRCAALVARSAGAATPRAAPKARGAPATDVAARGAAAAARAAGDDLAVAARSAAHTRVLWTVDMVADEKNGQAECRPN